MNFVDFGQAEQATLSLLWFCSKNWTSFLILKLGQTVLTQVRLLLRSGLGRAALFANSVNKSRPLKQSSWESESLGGGGAKYCCCCFFKRTIIQNTVFLVTL